MRETWDPLAAPDGKVHVQIRDLDQTVIGNPNHDLIRLALSLSSAARGSDLPGVTTAHMLEQMMIGYQRALKGPRAQNQIESDKPECIKVVMRRATARTWKHLARERLEDVKPTIPRGERFWPLTKNESKAIDDLFEDDEVRKLVTSLKSRPDDATIEVLDAAYWMKGCSSLGRLRFAVLLRVGTGKKRDDEFCLIDIKEATPAAAPRATRAVMPKDNAQRVVEGAKHLSPALGERMMASKTPGAIGGDPRTDAAGFETRDRSAVAGGGGEFRSLSGRGRGQGACAANGRLHAARICLLIQSAQGRTAERSVLALVKRRGARVRP